MKQCPKCKKKLTDEALFCFVCGALREEKQFHKGEEHKKARIKEIEKPSIAEIIRMEEIAKITPAKISLEEGHFKPGEIKIKSDREILKKGERSPIQQDNNILLHKKKIFNKRMNCPHCDEKLPHIHCSDCGEEIPEDSRYCCWCRKLVSVKVAEIDFSKRILCSDGCCIGIINDRGICNVCGKPLGWIEKTEEHIESKKAPKPFEKTYVERINKVKIEKKDKTKPSIGLKIWTVLPALPIISSAILLSTTKRIDVDATIVIFSFGLIILFLAGSVLKGREWAFGLYRILAICLGIVWFIAFFFHRPIKKVSNIVNFQGEVVLFISILAGAMICFTVGFSKLQKVEEKVCGTKKKRKLYPSIIIGTCMSFIIFWSLSKQTNIQVSPPRFEEEGRRESWAEKPKAEKPKAEKPKAMKFAGAIAAYEAGKMIEVKGAQDKKMTFDIAPDAKLKGEIKEGAKASVIYKEDEGKVLATSISVTPPASIISTPHASPPISKGTESATPSLYVPGIINVARMLYNDGEYEKATEAYKRVLEIDPHNREALTGIERAKKAKEAEDRVLRR